MTIRVLTGSKQEIAQGVADIEGDVREAIVFPDEPAPAACVNAASADGNGEAAADILAEMEPYTVQVNDFNDAREAIYSRGGRVILLDTNLLARPTSKAHPHCLVARSAVHTLLGGRERLIIVPQNLFEFWAVATRQSGPPPVGQNGLGMAVEQASQWLGFFKRRFTLLPDRGDMPTRWQDLVRTLGVRGFRSHDARLVAAMQSYGITRLLTFNGADFQGLGVSVVDSVSV